MKKVCVVIGTRPEAIKMAPVILALREKPSDFEVIICSTGQHTTMLNGAFAAFDLQPDVELNVMTPGQSLPELTSRLILALDRQFELIDPDLVLVHGDTSTAMAGAMASFYRQINVGHVEAGLRTNNLLSPFPEEYNRRSVAIATQHHFAPTPTARTNLEREGIDPAQILVTGNTVIDALMLTIGRLRNRPSEVLEIRKRLISQLGFEPDEMPFILITAHRRENFGTGLEEICHSIRELAMLNPNLYFVYPVHLNPKVKHVVEKKLVDLKNVKLISPQDYRDFAWLMSHCLLVLTDSGGIQEEAPALGKPVLVMRDTSERPEAIVAGTAKLVSTDPKVVVRETQKLINDIAAYEKMTSAINPFGDGRASNRIADYFSNQR